MPSNSHRAPILDELRKNMPPEVVDLMIGNEGTDSPFNALWKAMQLTAGGLELAFRRGVDCGKPEPIEVSGDDRPSTRSLRMAAQIWCQELTSDSVMDPNVAVEIAKLIERFISALFWCSHSDDFGDGGKARKGWAIACQPLLDTWTSMGDVGGDDELGGDDD